MEQELQTQITSEELTNLKRIQEEYQTLIFMLGTVSSELILLNVEKDKITDTLKQFNTSKNEFFKQLGDKYGNQQIDLETGNLTPSL
jgi:hypothetical protein